MRPALQRGYTLVELVIVLVLVGILSAVVVSRFTGRQPYDEFGYAQQVAAAARYAQKLAISSGCPVQLLLTDASGFRLVQANDTAATACGASRFGQAGFGADVVDPAKNAPPYAGSTPTGLAVASSDGFPTQRVFDGQGRITPDADLTLDMGAHRVRIRHGGGQVVVETVPSP